VLDSTHVNWASLLAGNFTPDYTVPAWPGSWNGYPIFYAPGNLTFSFSLTTAITLVVQGNVTMASGSQFKGIMLVGGHVVTPGNGVTVMGAVVTGLNNLVTPNSAGNDTIPRGTTVFHWSPCEVNNALSGMSSMTPMRHTFMDTWATY